MKDQLTRIVEIIASPVLNQCQLDQAAILLGTSAISTDLVTNSWLALAKYTGKVIEQATKDNRLRNIGRRVVGEGCQENIKVAAIAKSDSRFRGTMILGNRQK